MSGIEPLIVVHGGAGDIPETRYADVLKGVCEAVLKGHNVLKNTGSVLDATIAAVESLEDNPHFNAGKGSVLTSDGTVEMEALIMEGRQMKVGSVTGLKNVAHPISVAKLVMDKTRYAILGFDSATQFARDNGVLFTPDSELVTPKSEEALKRFLEKDAKNIAETKVPGTVGAVGIDKEGHMVSCTSTGGMNGKMRGRIGDTPIPGSGGYCDDSIGCVSTTGHGESILRYNVAQRIMAQMEAGKSAQEASQAVLEGMSKRIGNTAGAITISKNGDIGVAFTSKSMSWAYIKGNKLYYGIKQGQVLTEDL